VVDPWFVGACDAAQYTRAALDAFITAWDVTDEGDPQGVLDWVDIARESVGEARELAEELPDWPDGEPFAEALERYLDQLELELDTLEDNPLGALPPDTFRTLIEGRFALGDRAPRVNRAGCGLDDVLN
jgi:hypothetical protein